MDKARKSLLILSSCALWVGSAHAVTMTWLNFTPAAIANETALPNGTTINFNIDTAGAVQITIFKVQNFGDPGTQVATLNQTFAGTGNQSIFWDGLWLINGELGRLNGNYSFTLTLSTDSGNASTTPPTLVAITSVDIHSLSVLRTSDTSGLIGFPYVVQYSLAKDSLVSISISDSSGTVVRKLIENKLGAGETSGVTSNSVAWDGLSDGGTPVPLGLYTVTLNATDAVSGDLATPRTRSIAVQSLAGSTVNAQKVFEDNVYVYPNPVRNGQGLFHVLPVRDNATIRLKIYTLTGDLVLDKDITGQLPFSWDVANQAGRKVGRGLYYYVVREEDPQGTLQTVKKMAVLP